ncbi:hypothetical protein [Flavobacterium sp. N502540]|uniref:hypothetical protein n=1 Tax=Flavobacterium sp. N502540 TaxID=2986838 RepID=UPI0022243791|nr:hypothetical protein [Flavobacterium sp. N502540]
MKKLPQKKSEVLKVMLVFVSAAFFISCNNESVEDQNTQLSNTEQQNQPDTKRVYYTYPIVVRAWGAHNVDCSQPEGFCNFTIYDTYRNYNFFKPHPDGTPVRVTNDKGNFVMEIQKSALTPEHKKVLLRNGEVYVIPEGQTIDSELVKSLKFNSDILVPGKYLIQESEATYTISIHVK